MALAVVGGGAVPAAVLVGTAADVLDVVLLLFVSMWSVSKVLWCSRSFPNVFLCFCSDLFLVFIFLTFFRKFVY